MDYDSRNYLNRLKVIRKSAGYRQQQVYEWFGHKNNVMLWEWENSVKMPGGENLIKLCIFYNKTPQELYPEYSERIQQHKDIFN